MKLLQTCQILHCRSQNGFATKTIPRLLLCPLNIPNLTIVHGIGCSLNLNISYYCSSVSWEYRQRLVEYGQAIDPQNLPLSGHQLLQKVRTVGQGPHPPPPLNKHNRFQHTVPSHIKSCTAHWGGRGVRGKKPGFFVTDCKESPDSISKASTHDCGMSIYLYHIRCQYRII